MVFSLPLPHLSELLSHYLLIMTRIATLLALAPVFSEKGISTRVRAALAVLITLLLGSSIAQTPLTLFSLAGVWALVREMLIGAALALSMQLLFVAVRLAGEIIGMQMGLSFATFYDPAAGNMPVIARFLNLLVTLLFLVFNGHLWLIALLAQSFERLPVSSAPLHAEGLQYLVSLAGVIFREGLMLGLPVIALLLCINITLGLLNRLTPQLSVFVIGFPLTLSLGLLALSLIVQTLARFTEPLINRFFEQLTRLITLLG